MKIWRCPECGSGVRAPQQPRRNDTRRFCLDCSAQSPILVERICPANERRREKSVARSRAKASGKAQAQSKRITKAFTAVSANGTAEVDMRPVFRRLKRLLVDKAQDIGEPGTAVVDVNPVGLHITSSHNPSIKGHVNVAKRGNPQRQMSIMAWRLLYLWSDGAYDWSGKNLHLWNTYKRLSFEWSKDAFRRKHGLPKLDRASQMLSIDPGDRRPQQFTNRQAKGFVYLGAIKNGDVTTVG